MEGVRVMRKFKIILMLPLLSLTVLLSGCLTGTIRGQVIDSYDRPVVGAIVSTQPPTEAVRTTKNGYVLKNVPIGEYVIKAEKPGYKPATAHIRVQWSQTTGADVQIERKK
jgi:hypothetical protein